MIFFGCLNEEFFKIELFFGLKLNFIFYKKLQFSLVQILAGINEIKYGIYKFGVILIRKSGVQNL